MGHQAVLFCSPLIRPAFKKMTASGAPRLALISYNEVAPNAQVQSVGMVNIEVHASKEVRRQIDAGGHRPVKADFGKKRSSCILRRSAEKGFLGFFGRTKVEVIAAADGQAR